MSPVCLFIQQAFLSSPQEWLLQTVTTLWTTQRPQEQGEWEVKYSSIHQSVLPAGDCGLPRKGGLFFI